MHRFVKAWNSHPAQVTSEDLLAGAKDLYAVLRANTLARGDESWPVEPKFVCFLTLPGLKKAAKFEESIREVFTKAAQLDWDPDKYVLVYVPRRIIGSRLYAVFAKIS